MSPQEKFSILIVDDDPMAVRILNRMLSAFTPLRFATSGPTALKLAREALPDLVLLDVEMPEFSGFEVCKAFKSDPGLSEVPIILITSHDSAQLEAKGFELGATDFIRKPLHAPLVLARVRTYQKVKRLSDTLRGAVTMDFLTGAVTRRELEKALARECLRSQRAAASIALLLIDIQDFTAYNAEMGEGQGDACLKSVADALRSVAHRPTDMLGRYAGGKFALLLPETDVQGAQTVAQHAIEAVHALQFPHPAASGKNCPVAVSVGGARYQFSRLTTRDAPEDTSSQTRLKAVVAEELIAAAEQALQGARSAGHHGVLIIDMGRPESAPMALFRQR